MANVNVAATELMPLGGSSNSGLILGFIDSAAKAAQNDTWTVTNASEIVHVVVTNDAAGTLDACTISSNVITLTDAATGASSGLIIYRPA